MARGVNRSRASPELLRVETGIMIAMYRFYSISQINERTGVSLSTIRFRLKKAGVLRTIKNSMRRAIDDGRLKSRKGISREFTKEWIENIGRGRREWAKCHVKNSQVDPNANMDLALGSHSRMDLSGRKFGRLKAVKRDGRDKTGKILWLCQCDCGKTSHVRTTSLNRGKSNSCGCINNEVTAARSVTHGMTKTRTYTSWKGMIGRCQNDQNDQHSSYGGRGITVCDEWQVFENFYNDMGERPAKKTIDRIDNDKGYYFDNCRWATMAEQNRNKRDTRWISFKGKTMTMTDWSSEVGLSVSCISSRLKKWSIEKTLTTPNQRKRKQ